jgi:thioredoxin 1
MSAIRYVIATVALLQLPVLSFAADLPSANDAIIRAALASGKPTIVDFGARTCIPCKKMAPILADLNSELKGKANVLFTNLPESFTLTDTYRIQMIPTQIFYDVRGNEVKRHIGFFDRTAILKELKAAGLK